MKNNKIHKLILLISGLIGAGFGAVILLIPVPFYATNGIELSGNISMLNEIRAAGGGLLACGIFIMSGAFNAKLTFTATVIATLIYLSYGLSRILSMTIDGMPVEGLIMASALEIVVGLICVYALLGYRKSEH